MDVLTPEQACIAEEAGAYAIMALECVPVDIWAQGGIVHMSDPGLIKEIKRAVTIPVMAKVGIGHFVEAQILEAIGMDYVDDREVLTPADETHHINKHNFCAPFVCSCRDLGEALFHIREGDAMIRYWNMQKDLGITMDLRGLLKIRVMKIWSMMMCYLYISSSYFFICGRVNLLNR
ncbi:hypothetical protein Taro_042997 [Colocasia esculenta]|uniref:pyridoxal 5'-phosphate synthase (glutamine hydrolyzing) n=1 Tax=Colocasia esculenta TaxID=4460 RepID=A0A843WXY0_COLES|nr:hypothetical protein [Colocasia esculenta]